MKKLYYLWRPAGNYGKLSCSTSSQYHLIRDDRKTSVCGVAVTGELGYEIVWKKESLLRSRICNNCFTGRTVRRKQASQK